MVGALRVLGAALLGLGGDVAHDIVAEVFVAPCWVHVGAEVAF